MIETINKICEWLPKGWEINLIMKKGGPAEIKLIGPDGRYTKPLPSSTGKTIVEQLNDAVCVARGWRDTP